MRGMAGGKALVALAIWLSSSRALAERRGAQEYHAVIQAPNGGPWGAWAWQEMCPEGTYATGFSIKVTPPPRTKGDGHFPPHPSPHPTHPAFSLLLQVEPYQGLANDDTGMNGIRLHCTQGGRGDKHQAHPVESQSGM